MKKLLLLLTAAVMLFSSAYAVEIPQVQAIAMRKVASVEEAILYAKEVWQYDFIAGYRENLQWNAEEINGLYEIYADDAETGARALSMAVTPDGGVAYLLNVESGAREAADYGTDAYDQDKALLDQMEQFANDAFHALSPGITDLQLESMRDETNLQNRYFVDFWQRVPGGSDGNAMRHIYLQVAPDTRVTFWVDLLLLPPSEAWERLEPNMGNG